MSEMIGLVASRARAKTADPVANAARIPPAEAAREMAAEFEAKMATFEHLSEESCTDVISGLTRSLRRWSQFLSTCVMPPDSDLTRCTKT